MFRRVPLAALVVVLAGCGGGSSTGETLAPLPTASTLAPATTSPDASTTSTSSSSTTTSTTVPDGSSLTLRSDSLGDARFGVEPASVVAYVESVVGAPDSDSGWGDSFSEFGTCPGTEVRGVRWGDLLVLFGDESDFESGRRHFFQWQYGPAAGDAPSPSGMVTDGGIGIGSTVTDLVRAHPDVEIFDDVVFGPGFEIEPGLWGTLTEVGDGGVVLALYGGTPCGE